MAVGREPGGRCSLHDQSSPLIPPRKRGSRASDVPGPLDPRFRGGVNEEETGATKRPQASGFLSAVARGPRVPNRRPPPPAAAVLDSPAMALSPPRASGLAHRTRHLRQHPRLLSATALAFAAYFLLPSWISVGTRLLTAFDVGAIVFLGAMWVMMARATPASCGGRSLMPWRRPSCCRSRASCTASRTCRRSW